MTAVAPACALASAFFGDGSAPAEVRVAGQAATVDAAIAAGAALLAGAAGRVLVVVAPGLTLEAQRHAIALADHLCATIDGATSAGAAEGILAAQRRGRTGATLGEVRHRADVLLYWGTDPSVRYPRFDERYGRASVGLQTPAGSRTSIGVTVGTDAAPAGTALAFTIAPEHELAALSLLRAAVRGAGGDAPPPLDGMAALAARLVAARYVALVHDAEPGDARRDPARAEALLALAMALNGPTRAALVSLRAGGNRNGFESVLTWQTGFPMAVDFAAGTPAYRPSSRGLDAISPARFGAVLVAGDAGALEPGVRQALAAVPVVAIGPRASVALPGARVAVDTGTAGVHEAGTAYRMDDVPLPVRAVVPHAVRAEGALAALRAGVLGAEGGP